VVISVAVIGLGIAVLAVAPDRFVSGAAGLADRWGLSRVVIGAVVIGFGTSTPELLVSGLAAAGGDPAVGVGNVIGSNMANLALVVPLAALITPLAVPSGLLRLELPLVVAATAAFAVAVQGGLGRVDGIVLAVGLVVTLTVVVRRAQAADPADGDGDAPADANGDDRRGHDEHGDPSAAALDADVAAFLADERTESSRRLVGTAAVGLLGTLAGAQLLVTGAVDVADRVGVSGGFVGLTVVAIGTSLPELVTAAAAARVGEGELVLGNVIGSNLFNALAVGAVIALVGPGRLDTSLTTGAVILMCVLTLAATAVMARRRAVTRGEALALLVTYLATLPLLAG
jgi:cation:H+ antiporter